MNKGRKIGLLGGSFNPAHQGHLHLSKEVLRVLGLDEVWWVISPQNPLKKASEIAPYAIRQTQAKTVMHREKRIRLCEIETEQGLRFTQDTIQALIKRYPQHRFVWLMGADNLAQFHRWRGWRRIAAAVPILICDRAPSSHPALRSPAALSLRKFRIFERNFRKLIMLTPPCWGYFFMRRHSESATRLRNLLGDNAFLRHNVIVGND